MIRYVAMPRAFIDDMDQQMMRFDYPRFTIVEESDGRNTGIVDVRGNPIYAVSQAEPIGFIPRNE